MILYKSKHGFFTTFSETWNTYLVEIVSHIRRCVVKSRGNFFRRVRVLKSASNASQDCGPQKVLISVCTSIGNLSIAQFTEHLKRSDTTEPDLRPKIFADNLRFWQFYWVCRKNLWPISSIVSNFWENMSYGWLIDKMIDWPSSQSLSDTRIIADKKRRIHGWIPVVFGYAMTGHLF